jgi:hypothetical protein
MNVVREDEPFDSSVTEDSPVIQPEEHSILSEIGDAYFISVSDSHRIQTVAYCLGNKVLDRFW